MLLTRCNESLTWMFPELNCKKNEEKGEEWEKEVKHVSMSICRDLENMYSARREAVDTHMGSFLRGLCDLKRASPGYWCLYLREPKWCVKLSISLPTLLVITPPTPPLTRTIWERIIWVWQKMQKQFIFPRLWKTAIKTIPNTLKIN